MGARWQPLLGVVVLAVVGAGAAFAQPIHKCRDELGHLAYQDQPCPQESLPTPLIAPPPENPYIPDLSVSAQDTAAPAGEVNAAAATPTPPLPVLYRCTRENDSSYVSDNPNPPPRYVPAWVVGATTRGNNLRRTPEQRANDAALGSMQVLVRDRCERMSPSALCAHWTVQHEEKRKAAQSTFFAERENNEAKREQLREQLITHCGW